MKRKLRRHLAVTAFLLGVSGPINASPPTNTSDLNVLTTKAQKGDVDAYTLIGETYLIGKGVPRDYKKAFEWFSQAADQNNTRAMTNLGVMYYRGMGVKQSYTKSRELLEKAANHNNNAKDSGVAYLFLGGMYFRGEGVEQNNTKAIQLFKKSCDIGTAKGCSAYLQLQK